MNTKTPEQLEKARERSRRHKERHRERIRAEGRDYAARKRRAAGIPAQGSEQSTANRRAARKATGDEHGNWKGDGVGYVALHTWVARNKERTGVCDHCGAEPEPKSTFRRVGTEFANVSGEYKRDVDDWMELCVSCHRRYDRRPV